MGNQVDVVFQIDRDQGGRKTLKEIDSGLQHIGTTSKQTGADMDKAFEFVKSDIYVHLGDKILSEGSEMLAEEFLTNCDLFVTQKSEMVS